MAVPRHIFQYGSFRLQELGPAFCLPNIYWTTRTRVVTPTSKFMHKEAALLTVKFMHKEAALYLSKCRLFIVTAREELSLRKHRIERDANSSRRRRRRMRFPHLHSESRVELMPTDTRIPPRICIDLVTASCRDAVAGNLRIWYEMTPTDACRCAVVPAVSWAATVVLQYV